MARKKRRRMKGTGCVVRRGGTFAIRWWDGERRRFRGGFATWEDAARVLVQVTNGIAVETAPAAPDAKGGPVLDALAADWLKRRQVTHRSHGAARLAWKNHLALFFGKRRPNEVNTALIRQFIEAKLAEPCKPRGKAPEGETAKPLSPATVRLFVRQMSTFYSDLVERGIARTNPFKDMPRATRRLIKPSYDPARTPFLEKLDDVMRVYRALPSPVNVAFAVGAFAGLRTGEILALEWRDIDLKGRRLYVRRQVQDSKMIEVLKDREARVAPILPALERVLKKYHLSTGGSGLLFPPTSPKQGKGCQYMKPHTLHAELRGALDACKLPRMSWYSSTRHTCASQLVLAGWSLEKVGKVLGHSSPLVTQRYAHLRVDLFSAEDMAALDVNLAAPRGKVISMRDRRKLDNRALDRALKSGVTVSAS